MYHLILTSIPWPTDFVKFCYIYVFMIRSISSLSYNRHNITEISQPTNQPLPYNLGSPYYLGSPYLDNAQIEWYMLVRHVSPDLDMLY